MFGYDNDEIIEQLFESLLQKSEENLQNKMKGSEFEFDVLISYIMILIKQA